MLPHTTWRKHRRNVCMYACDTNSILINNYNYVVLLLFGHHLLLFTPSSGVLINERLMNWLHLFIKMITLLVNLPLPWVHFLFFFANASFALQVAVTEMTRCLSGKPQQLFFSTKRGICTRVNHEFNQLSWLCRFYFLSWKKKVVVRIHMFTGQEFSKVSPSWANLNSSCWVYSFILNGQT